jgi:tryptophan synthase alpha chain
MSQIEKVFESKKVKQAILIPYVMAGYPSLSASKRIIEQAIKVGAGLVELGIPYSDPLADGPSIQKAGEVALRQKVTTTDVFALAQEITRSYETPIVVMTYFNTIFRYGLERFAREAAEAGVAGVISPDLSPEEATSWKEVAQNYQLDTIFLVAPTSTKRRIKKIVSMSSGFIYLVSLTGVTGARDRLPEDLADFIKRVRSYTSKPLAVGFGVSRPEQAKLIATLADGVIIGSALINLIEKYPNDYLERLAVFLSDIKAAMDGTQ